MIAFVLITLISLGFMFNRLQYALFVSISLKLTLTLAVFISMGLLAYTRFEVLFTHSNQCMNAGLILLGIFLTCSCTDTYLMLNGVKIVEVKNNGQ